MTSSIVWLDFDLPNVLIIILHVNLSYARLCVDKYYLIISFIAYKIVMVRKEILCTSENEEVTHIFEEIKVPHHRLKEYLIVVAGHCYLTSMYLM